MVVSLPRDSRDDLWKPPVSTSHSHGETYLPSYVRVLFCYVKQVISLAQTLADAAVVQLSHPASLPSPEVDLDDLPKTRSGKIMRWLLEDLSNSEELGDTTTLRDPSMPKQIRQQVHGD